MNVTRITGGSVFLAMAILVLPGWCGERKREDAGKAERTEQPQVEPETVELFAAMRDGKIEVAVVPQSYTALTVRVRNNTQIPLRIELPATFAAVPTARLQAVQAMQAGRAPMSLANGYGQGGSQGLGGSFGGPWSGGAVAQREGAQGPGGEKPAQDGPRYWMLAPRKMLQTQIPCFCLEFGKPDPHSRIPYQLCPLPDLNSRPTVHELLDQFAKQGVNQSVAQQSVAQQSVAQLAAWHVANDVPWPMLSKVQFPRTLGSRSHRVTAMELRAAKQLAESLPSYGRPASLADQ